MALQFLIEQRHECFGQCAFAENATEQIWDREDDEEHAERAGGSEDGAVGDVSGQSGEAAEERAGAADEHAAPDDARRAVVRRRGGFERPVFAGRIRHAASRAGRAIPGPPRV